MAIQWMLVLYSLFMGLAIGPFGLLAITDASAKRPALSKWASVVGLVCIVIAGVFAFSHLGKPLSAIYVFSNFRSPMTQETAMVVVTGIVAAVLAASMLFNFLPGLRKPLAWIGLVLSVVSVIMIAGIYLLPARPAWNIWLLPLALLMSSLINGLLLAWVLAAFVPVGAGETDRPALVEKLRSWALPVLVLYAAVAIVYFLMAASLAGGIVRILIGDLAFWFWLGLIVVGLAAPAVLVWFGKKSPKLSVLAAFVFLLVGGLVVRALLFPLGMRVPITSLW